MEDLGNICSSERGHAKTSLEIYRPDYAIGVEISNEDIESGERSLQSAFMNGAWANLALAEDGSWDARRIADQIL